MKKRIVARVYQGTAPNIAFLAKRLQAGDLVAVPSETVYGLAANAFDVKACRKIFIAKGRPTFDPLIVHVYSIDQLQDVCRPNPEAMDLARTFWPGPLTLVLPKKATIPDIVTAGRQSVAVRMPSHPVFRRLLRVAKIPLAAPSANLFGYVSPTTAAHVREGLGTKIRYILEGGPSTIGLESTIIDLRNPKRPTLLRPGFVTVPEIQNVLGRKLVKAARPTPGGAAAGQVAPGLLARHYSPRTQVVLHPTIPAEEEPGEGQAFVVLRRPSKRNRSHVYWLDTRGDLRGVARRLFSTLRDLDEMGYESIHVELAPESGLGEAINDRLRRAAAR